MEDLEYRIDCWIDRRLEEMLTHMKELIRIPSIAKYDPERPHPFGDGCAAALDYMLHLADSMGFQTRNYDYYSGSARLPGRTEYTIGIFVHLDTTPSTDVWSFRPFDPEVRNGYLIGCGAQDNKGSAVTMLYLLRCMAELGLQLDHTVLLVFGCGKKSRMQDIDRFLFYERAPAVSLVADADFPVCLGEKGSLDFELSCPVDSARLVDFRAGSATNMVPSQAFALLDGVDCGQVRTRMRDVACCSVIQAGRYVKVATGGLGGHAAFPEGTQSPVPMLAQLLLDSGLIEDGSALAALRFLRDTYRTCLGEPFGLDVRDEDYGFTTHVCGLVRMRAGTLYQTVNVRYVPSVDCEQAEQRARQSAEQAGMTFRRLSNSPPSAIEPQVKPYAALLTSIANRILGKRLHEYMMGGVTYAKKLPNAIAFGPNRCDLPSPFGLGRGSGHMPDEAVRIQDLTNGLKIYVISLLRLDPLI